MSERPLSDDEFSQQMTRRHFLVLAGAAVAAAANLAANDLETSYGDQAQEDGIYDDVNSQDIPSASDRPLGPLLRTAYKPISFDSYYAMYKDLPPSEVERLGIGITTTTEVNLINSPHIILTTNLPENQQRYIGFDTTNSDPDKELENWKNILSIDVKDMPFELRYALRSMAYVMRKDGTVHAYDMYSEQEGDSKSFFIDTIVDDQVFAEGLSDPSSDKSDYDKASARRSELTDEYLTRIRTDLDSDTALALSASRVALCQAAKDIIAWDLGVMGEAMVQTILDLTGDMFTEEEIKERLGNITFQPYDYLAQLAQDPSTPRPNFSGYYAAPDPNYDVGPGYVVNVDYLSKSTTGTLIHEVLGHYLAGSVPVEIDNGYTFTRRNGGGYTGFAISDTGDSLVYFSEYGAWINESWAEFTIGEVYKNLQDREYHDGVINHPEISILYALLTAPFRSVGLDIAESYTNYAYQPEAQELASLRQAFGRFIYASRSTDGPRGFTGAEYPFNDDSVKSRKELIAAVDGNFGPGFFNRINLAMTKAEFYAKDNNGGHATYGMPYDVVCSIVEALHYDTNQTTPSGFNLTLSNNLSLPWFSNSKTIKESAIQSEAYATFLNKYPVTYAVLNNILAAKTAEELTETLNAIHVLTGGPRANEA